MCSGEGAEGEGGEQRVRERSEGSRGVSVASLEGPGTKQGVSRASARVVTRPPAYCQEVEDDREVEVGWAGFARLGCYSGGLVGPPGRFSLFLF